MTPYSFLDNYLKGKEIKIFNNGKHMRDFTYIDDVIISILKIFDYSQKKNKKKFDIVNIAKGKSIELMKYINLIEMNLGNNLKKKFVSGQLGDVKNTYADIKKLKKYTNFKPKVNIDTGIKKFIEWFSNYHNLKNTNNSKNKGILKKTKR